MDPGSVRDRWLELLQPGAVAALRARCEAETAAETAVPFNWWAAWPRPFPRELAGEDPLQASSRTDARLGVDASGRVVFQHLRDDLFQLFDWADERCDLVEVNSELCRLRRFVFADGRLVEEIEVTGHGTELTRWTYADGRPARTDTTTESGTHVHTFTYDADGELAAIAGPRRLLYDARTHRRETELPDPEHAYDGLAEPLADALVAALPPGPFDLVIVYPGGRTPELIPLDEAFVARGLRALPNTDELLSTAYHELRVDVLETAPPDVLRRIRAGHQAHADPTGLGHELVDVLRARLPCPVELWGAQSIAKHFSGRFTRTKPPKRVRDRDELAALLADAGLTRAEAAAIAGDAEWGLVLGKGGTGVSRLGGAPVLAAGTPWPHAGERPLTHLATIALAELPAVEGRDYLPADGLLSFFADLDDEAEFFEDDHAGEGGLARVLHTPAGADTEAPAPPGEVLDELRVTFTPRLQLRHRSLHYQPALDELAHATVRALADRLNGKPYAQLLGHPLPLQEDHRTPGQRVVFHICERVGIGFAIMDGGDLTFLGEADRWDQLTVIPDSC